MAESNVIPKSIKPRQQEGEEEVESCRKARSEFPHLCIVYKDDKYLVVNKQNDLRLDGEFSVTLKKMMEQAFPEIEKFRFVHQIDYATSGVLVIGLTRKSTGDAGKLFSSRKAKKKYLAVVWGHVDPTSIGPKQGFSIVSDGESVVMMVDIAIGEIPGDFRMALGFGRPAQTYITVLGYGVYQGKSVTKLLLEPHSGRRHQLRLHALHIGHPIVGDATYTNDWASPRMMLHAWQLCLPFSQRQGIGHEIIFRTEDPFEELVEWSQTAAAGTPFPEIKTIADYNFDFSDSIKADN